MKMTAKRLAVMIRRRDRLAAELAEIEPAVKEGIAEFSRGHGYLVPLRIEQVRPMLRMDSTGFTSRTAH